MVRMISITDNIPLISDTADKDTQIFHVQATAGLCGAEFIHILNYT